MNRSRRDGTTITRRRSRWAWTLLGFALTLAPLAMATATASAQTQAAGPTLTLARLWNQGGTAGSWTPYAITVRNEGTGNFTGTVVLLTDGGFSKGGPPAAYPEYRAAVTVPAGSQRTVNVYAMESSSGYHAELRTTDGRLLSTATPPSGGGSGAAVAVVSDVSHAEQRVDALLRSESQFNAAVAALPGGASFPSSVIRLSGLNAIVLDQADSGALDDDQRRALLDFVGLGGTLIEAGGAGARRTTAFLPAALLPFRPTGTATASLASLGELGGVATAETTQVATGDVAPAARVRVAAADGTPLIVEGTYGAGTVVALTFDPLAPPFDGDLDLGAAAWVQALSRGLGGAQGSGSAQLTRMAFGAGMPGSGPPIGSGPGAASGFQGYLAQVLNDTPAVASPPLGLLALLLALYVLVVSGAAYAVLKAVGRRGLLWVAVPATAIVCTAGAYVVGFGIRGSDYQLAQIQVQRLAPGGVVETSSIDGILSPRRGDITVTTPAGALVTTATPFLPFETTDFRAARITVANPAEVVFPNVAVWDMRPLQTLSVTHAGGAAGLAMPIDAQLGVRSGRLVGQVANHTSQEVRNLQLVSPSGARAALVPALAAGATITVDVRLGQDAPGIPVGKGLAPVVIGPNVGPIPPQNGSQAMVALAASEVAVRQGEWALVGEVTPAETLRVAGQRPSRTGRAMVAEPVRLQFADSAATGATPARLVGTYAPSAGGVVEVYEQDLPSGLTGGVTLATSVVPGPNQPSVTSVEVYDWDQHTWRALRATAGAMPATALTAGERRNGVVRARVTAAAAGQVAIAVGDAA